MKNNNGFAIALDALMAIILVTALIVFLSQQTDVLSPGLGISQHLQEQTGNAFVALENGGTLGNLLVEQAFDSTSAQKVYREAKKFLPGNVDVHVRVTVFQQKPNLTACRTTKTMQDCFSDGNISESVNEIPAGKEVFYGRRLMVFRQPSSDTVGPKGEAICQVEGDFSPKKTVVDNQKVLRAMFQDYNAPVLEFKTTAFTNLLQCADSNPPNLSPPQNPPGSYPDSSNITIFARNQTRNPMDVILVLDVSGSMSTYDMNLQTGSGTLVVDQNSACALNNSCNSPGACIQTPVANTNCGWPSGQSGGYCKEPDGNYANRVDFNLSWKLTPELYGILPSSGAKLKFGQAEANTYYGACSGCSSGTTKSPFIFAVRNSDQLAPTRLESNQLYYLKSQVASNDTFKVSGWNSDNTLSVKFGALAFVDPAQSYLSKSHGTIPADLDITNCQYSFPNSVNGCNSDRSVCGNYKRFKTVDIPGASGVFLPDALADKNRFMNMNTYLNFDSLPSGACRPAVKYIYTPASDSSQHIIEDPGYFSCNNPTSYCYAYFPYAPSGNGFWYYLNSPGYRDRVNFGTYEVYVAADKNLTNTTSTVNAFFFLDYLYTPPTHYNNGTCAGSSCFFNITQPANCPAYGGDSTNFCQNDSSSMTMVNDISLGTFSISGGYPYLRGLRMETTVWDYNGTCSYAAIGATRPGDSSQHVITAVPSTGVLRILSHGINDKPSEYGVHANMGSASIPLQDGAYSLRGWAPEATKYNMRWVEQRVDAAQEAASRFIDKNGWKSEDRIGIVTYSDSASVLDGLLDVNSANQAILKTSMNSITPGGETYTADGIQKARQQIPVNPDRGRFIILLSDGLANIPSNDPTGAAVQEAQVAYQSGVTVYTIGFGIEAIDWNQQLNGGAGGWECADQLRQIAIAGGGVCYPANDPLQLQSIYDQIANQIQQSLGKTDIEMPLYEGMQYNNPTCNPSTDCTDGIWLRTCTDSKNCSDVSWNSVGNWYNALPNQWMVFKNTVLNQINSWWDANFSVSYPCDSTQCANTRRFPPARTCIRTSDGCIYWPTEDDQQGDPEIQDLNIRTRDVGFSFLDGNVYQNQTSLHYQLSNNQELSVNFGTHQESQHPNFGNGCSLGQIEVRFYQGLANEPPDFNQPPFFSQCIEPDPPPGDRLLSTGESKDFFTQIGSSNGGVIYAIINPNRGTTPIKQCTEDDWGKIFCFANPAEQYFAIEYWGWLS